MDISKTNLIAQKHEKFYYRFWTSPANQSQVLNEFRTAFIPRGWEHRFLWKFTLLTFRAASATTYIIKSGAKYEIQEQHDNFLKILVEMWSLDNISSETHNEEDYQSILILTATVVQSATISIAYGLLKV